MQAAAQVAASGGVNQLNLHRQDDLQSLPIIANYLGQSKTGRAAGARAARVMFMLVMLTYTSQRTNRPGAFSTCLGKMRQLPFIMLQE